MKWREIIDLSVMSLWRNFAPVHKNAQSFPNWSLQKRARAWGEFLILIQLAKHCLNLSEFLICNSFPSLQIVICESILRLVILAHFNMFEWKEPELQAFICVGNWFTKNVWLHRKWEVKEMWKRTLTFTNRKYVEEPYNYSD